MFFLFGIPSAVAQLNRERAESDTVASVPFLVQAAESPREERRPAYTARACKQTHEWPAVLGLGNKGARQEGGAGVSVGSKAAERPRQQDGQWKLSCLLDRPRWRIGHRWRLRQLVRSRRLVCIGASGPAVVGVVSSQ